MYTYMYIEGEREREREHHRISAVLVYWCRVRGPPSVWLESSSLRGPVASSLFICVYCCLLLYCLFVCFIVLHVVIVDIVNRAGSHIGRDQEEVTVNSSRHDAIRSLKFDYL